MIDDSTWIVVRTEDDLPSVRYDGMLAYVTGRGWFAVRDGEWKACDD